ncbi:MAG: sodium:calcium antiporter, partial [Bacteroidales bacterium]|nr:sodium:calcium antiporter [Bacteroidales bacterium]
ILGITGIIQKIDVSELTIHFDIFWVLGIAFLLLMVLFPASKSRISRFEGTILFVTYMVYMVFLFKIS